VSLLLSAAFGASGADLVFYLGRVGSFHLIVHVHLPDLVSWYLLRKHDYSDTDHKKCDPKNSVNCDQNPIDEFTLNNQVTWVVLRLHKLFIQVIAATDSAIN